MADGAVLDRAGIDELIAVLAADYTVIGPTVRDETIVLAEIASTADLPVGLRDDQRPGRYRLVDRADGALFGFVIGPHSPKRFLHPPHSEVWSGRRTGEHFVTIEPPEPPRLAFVGVRPCEVAAIAIQDRVFLGDTFRDEVYASRRGESFVVAVNCTEPAETCFCGSMGTGPGVTAGFDLAITEILDDGTHRYLATAGSDQGRRTLDRVTSKREPADADLAAERQLLEDAAGNMGRTLDTEGIRELLHANLENPVWDDIADRCLGCTNCTLVCPTCFCTTIEDSMSLDGATARRTRRWDSCFTLDFSYIHGGAIRQSGGSRYRQWLTHKLGSWIDQFGVSGCVGCGRCITWCPVGIDITVEAAAIRASDRRRLGRVATTAGVTT